jgi:NTP pyrophosphatase (non-canonical NTP hydrolase)
MSKRTMTPVSYQKFVDENWSRNDKIPRKGTAKRTYYDLRQLYIMSTGIGGEAGEVQELLKKSVRDGVLDPRKLKLELGDVLHYVTKIASQHGMSLQEVMDANVVKLNARRKRKERRNANRNSK